MASQQISLHDELVPSDCGLCGGCLPPGPRVLAAQGALRPLPPLLPQLPQPPLLRGVRAGQSLQLTPRLQQLLLQGPLHWGLWLQRQLQGESPAAVLTVTMTMLIHAAASAC